VVLCIAAAADTVVPTIVLSPLRRAHLANWAKSAVSRGDNLCQDLRSPKPCHGPTNQRNDRRGTAGAVRRFGRLY